MSEQAKKQNTYTSGFKEPAVKLANESDQPIAATARDLSQNVYTLQTWVGKYSKPKKSA
ncbi:transposase [Methyloprofundus sedimenti]|uniref:Transposase n=1 Tax=Methyloprofundus sedimenti TaxID=1420851 RepID=A0A1V8M4T6_9GAMM|nr:transposase [Methyloprofundus sedimenti]OQK16569.1 transposase [Methyloprofundus sedimenti]